MKHTVIAFIIGCLIVTGVYPQGNPRRFIKPVSLCPIDHKTIYSGFEYQATINIKKDTIVLRPSDIVPRNARLIDASNRFQVTDTVFKYVVTTSSIMAFEVYEEIGSFTIIKLWDYSKKTTPVNETSGYSYYKNISQTNPMAKLSSIIRGKKTVTAQEQGAGADSIINPTKDFYLIKTADLQTKTQEFEYKKWAWNVGLMFLPIKVRPFATRSGVFDFSSNLSVGTSFAWTTHHDIATDRTTNILFYTGVSSVKVDSVIAGDPEYKGGTQNITSFSPAIGIYSEKKGIQLGLLVGMDFLAGKLQQTWVYRGMPWISITAGVNLFTLTNNGSGKTGTNKAD